MSGSIRKEGLRQLATDAARTITFKIVDPAITDVSATISPGSRQ